MSFVITPTILPLKLTETEKNYYYSNPQQKASKDSSWLFQESNIQKSSLEQIFSPTLLKNTPPHIPPQETVPINIDFYDYGGSVREMQIFRALLEKSAKAAFNGNHALTLENEEPDFDLIVFCLDANDEELNAYATRKMRNEMEQSSANAMHHSNENFQNHNKGEFNNLASVADVTNKVLDDFKLGGGAQNSEISTLANYVDLHPINESALAWFSSCFYSNNVFLSLKKTPLMILSNHKSSSKSAFGSSDADKSGIDLDQLYEAFSLEKLEKNDILFSLHDVDFENAPTEALEYFEWAIKHFVLMK